MGAHTILLSIGLVIVLTTAPMLGQAPPAGLASQQDFVLAGEIMSPYCPGRTLAACPSPAAAELRKEVAARLAMGESRDAIVDSLVARFGEDVRGVPRAVGAGLVLWVLPPLLGALLLGALVTLGWHARGPAARPRPAAPGLPGTAALRQRLEDELEQMD